MITKPKDDWAIELTDLSKRYGRTLAVDNLSLRIARGSDD